MAWARGDLPASIDLDVVGEPVEHRVRGEPVDHDDVGLGQQAQTAGGDQGGVTGAAADQGDVSGAGPGAPYGELAELEQAGDGVAQRLGTAGVAAGRHGHDDVVVADHGRRPGA